MTTDIRASSQFRRLAEEYLPLLDTEVLARLVQIPSERWTSGRYVNRQGCCLVGHVQGWEWHPEYLPVNRLPVTQRYSHLPDRTRTGDRVELLYDFLAARWGVWATVSALKERIRELLEERNGTDSIQQQDPPVELAE